jgi:hypothetical protein
MIKHLLKKEEAMIVFKNEFQDIIVTTLYHQKVGIIAAGLSADYQTIVTQNNHEEIKKYYKKYEDAERGHVEIFNAIKEDILGELAFAKMVKMGFNLDWCRP